MHLELVTGGKPSFSSLGSLAFGPKLFMNSFDLIGAMLSHEVEGHWRTQMFRANSLEQDSQSFWMREVQAYDMELSPSNINRFDLNSEEVFGERQKRDRYYDLLNSSNKSQVSHHLYRPLGD